MNEQISFIGVFLYVIFWMFGVIVVGISSIPFITTEKTKKPFFYYIECFFIEAAVILIIYCLLLLWKEGYANAFAVGFIIGFVYFIAMLIYESSSNFFPNTETVICSVICSGLILGAWGIIYTTVEPYANVLWLKELTNNLSNILSVDYPIQIIDIISFLIPNIIYFFYSRKKYFNKDEFWDKNWILILPFIIVFICRLIFAKDLISYATQAKIIPMLFIFYNIFTILKNYQYNK